MFLNKTVILISFICVGMYITPRRKKTSLIIIKLFFHDKCHRVYYLCINFTQTKFANTNYLLFFHISSSWLADFRYICTQTTAQRLFIFILITHYYLWPVFIFRRNPFFIPNFQSQIRDTVLSRISIFFPNITQYCAYIHRL